MNSILSFCTPQLFERIDQLNDEIDYFLSPEDKSVLFNVIYLLKDRNISIFLDKRFVVWAQANVKKNDFFNTLINFLLNDLQNGSNRVIVKNEIEDFLALKTAVKLSFEKLDEPILCINDEQLIEEMGKLLKPDIIGVDRTSHYTIEHWSDLAPLTFPSDSLVLVDNYICSYYNLYNLTSILKVFLSKQKKDIKVDITIITSKLYNNEQGEMVALSEVYDRINKSLNGFKSDVSFNLTIVLCKTFENHMRAIYTRYFTFKCDNSFNFFDEKTSDRRLRTITNLNIYPNIAVNGDKRFFDFYESDRKQLCKIVMEADKQNVKGNRKNYLLGID